MREYLELGPVPGGEACQQVGVASYDPHLARLECLAYLQQLLRLFPPVHGTGFAVKAFPHDFGSYHEVCVLYDGDNEAQVEYAFRVEGNLPEQWDEKAKELLNGFSKEAA